MPYINVDVAYFTHMKTVRLIGLLGRGAEVLPIRLWCHCGEHHCEDGALTGYSEQEIETAVLWWGKTGLMVPAMEKAEFLERDGDSWRVRSWLEHQGHIAAYKARGRAMAEARWKKVRDATSMLAAQLAAMPKLDELDKNNRSLRSRRRTDNSYVLSKELERIEKDMDSIRNSYDAHQTISNDDAVKLRLLKNERKTIREALGLP